MHSIAVPWTSAQPALMVVRAAYGQAAKAHADSAVSQKPVRRIMQQGRYAACALQKTRAAKERNSHLGALTLQLHLY